MSQRQINIIAGVALPVLLFTLGMAATALGDYGDRRAREAVVDQRLSGVEAGVREHAASAKRVEDTVTDLRVDMAEFVGDVKARIGALEIAR